MPFSENPPTELGTSIPAHTDHAVSVTLPSWAANIGYEEGADWVVKRMKNGYPRFFINLTIQKLMKEIEQIYGRSGESCMIFPTYTIACRARTFVKEKSALENCPVRILQLSTPEFHDEKKDEIRAHISVIFFPASEFPVAKKYWQHSGEGISSRLAEYFLNRMSVPGNETTSRNFYQAHHKRASASPEPASERKIDDESTEQSQFVEQRFGRNLDQEQASQAKGILKRRIAGKLTDDSSAGYSTHRKHISEDDVFLYPSGMASIFNAHLLSMTSLGDDKKSVCYGFPYADTLKVLEKFGPGAIFYGNGEEDDLDDLQRKLKDGLVVLALYTEFPSNPLLKTPNLPRIRQLADKYGFAVIVDETIGNFLNVHVLPYADIVVSSLTKVFSGDSNVMAGSLVLNPDSRHYDLFKSVITRTYENTLWYEDAIFLERNSRDFEERSVKINHNAEAVAKLFSQSPLIKDVYYPKFSASKENYEKCRISSGGYGGLMSIVFKNPENAPVFFDAVRIAKGPSLGTNFTLTCPYTIIAHYLELDEVEKYGVDRFLIRISVGLEQSDALLDVFREALQTVDESQKNI